MVTLSSIILEHYTDLVIPIIWLQYAFSAIIFLISGLLLIDRRKSGYTKFLLIWLVSMMLLAAICVFFTVSPVSTLTIVNFFRTLG